MPCGITLPHVRLIVEEGRWSPIQDFHFALPFAWTLSFLPFELVGLPQGAQLLSLMLLVTGSTLAAALRRIDKATAIPIVALVVLHPFVLRAHVEAGADPYSILVVAVIAVLLSRLPTMTAKEAIALGFASWIGIGSRYQLVAIGLAVTVVFVVAIRKSAKRATLMTRGAIGAVVAILLASPFDLANAKWFGNPVWPLMIARERTESSYADLVAWYYGRSPEVVNPPT